MDSLDNFRTVVGLHRVRIAQEADQHIAQFLSLDQHTQRAERSLSCTRPATAAQQQHLREALIPSRKRLSSSHDRVHLRARPVEIRGLSSECLARPRH